VRRRTTVRHGISTDHYHYHYHYHYHCHYHYHYHYHQRHFHDHYHYSLPLPLPTSPPHDKTRQMWLEQQSERNSVRIRDHATAAHRTCYSHTHITNTRVRHTEKRLPRPMRGEPGTDPVEYPSLPERVGLAVIAVLQLVEQRANVSMSTRTRESVYTQVGTSSRSGIPRIDRAQTQSTQTHTHTYTPTICT
jgi:hypothetical protein